MVKQDVISYACKQLELGSDATIKDAHVISEIRHDRIIDITIL